MAYIGRVSISSEQDVKLRHTAKYWWRGGTGDIIDGGTHEEVAHEIPYEPPNTNSEQDYDSWMHDGKLWSSL